MESTFGFFVRALSRKAVEVPLKSDLRRLVA